MKHCLLTILSAGVLPAAACPQTRWVLRADSGPSARLPAMSYDEARGRVVQFSGFGSTPLPADTWEWDGASWTQRFPPRSPSGRSDHALTYDATRTRITMFGGRDDQRTILGDTWTWDGQTWTLAANSGPAPRGTHAMAYDAARERVVLFGGFTSIGQTFLGDTWEWDGQVWREMTSVNGPAPRAQPEMAYDAARQRVVLYGGSQGDIFAPFFADTWEWDGLDWRQRHPAVSPGSRRGHAMAYDAARQRVVLVGGLVSFTLPVSDETWEWDGSTWTLRQPVGTPGHIAHAGLACDRDREVLVLFGGAVQESSTIRYSDDTWEYSPDHPATYTPFGQSCAGTQSTPTLAARAGDRPWAGDTFTVEVRGVQPAQPVVMLTGFSDTKWNGLRLPFPLDPIGMPGCWLYTGPEVATSVANPLGLASWSVSIPIDAGPLGLGFFNQAVVLDPGVNALGLVTTNGGAGTLGAR